MTYFEPVTFGAELRAIGLAQVEDLGPDELHERYFKGRTDRLRPPGDRAPGESWAMNSYVVQPGDLRPDSDTEQS
jgi:hypothetical protein